MKWTDENIRKIEKFIEIKNKGLYCSGEEVQKVYNYTLERNLPPTNCGSCLRQRISELERALNQFKSMMAIEKPQEEEKQEKKNKKVKKQ